MDPLDAESIAQLAAQEVQGIDTASNCSENTILYELDTDMISQNNIEIVNSESVNNSNDLDELPDINQLRAELTVLGGQTVLHLTLLCLLTIHQLVPDIH